MMAVTGLEYKKKRLLVSLKEHEGNIIDGFVYRIAESRLLRVKFISIKFQVYLSRQHLPTFLNVAKNRTA